MQIGISVTKSVSFRGVQQEFANTYHYHHPTALTAPYESLVDEIIAEERKFHSTDVTFVRCAVWTSGGLPAQNEMKFQKNLSGLGLASTNASQDRERAVLIRWPAGVDTRGKPVYLRKWYHSCGSFNTTAFVAGNLQNTAAIASGERTTIAAAAEALREIGGAESWNLVAQSGRENTGQAQCHAYLEHHQLGDMWR